MQRNDYPALLHLVIWLALLVVSGTGAYLTLGTLWCVPFFFVYGILYGSCSDSRWHEFGHGTALRTRWINDAAFQLAAFMVFREPTVCGAGATRATIRIRSSLAETPKFLRSGRRHSGPWC